MIVNDTMMLQTPLPPNSAPPFIWPVRVYYEDTDAGGIVFYANYLKFFERARTEWLRAAGCGQQLLADTAQVMFVVASTSLQYHASARLDDELAITVQIEKIGRASMEFTQQARRGDTVLCSCQIRIGCVNKHSLRPCLIPAHVLELIQQHYQVGTATQLAILKPDPFIQV